MDKRVTSPTWGPPPPCKQALSSPCKATCNNGEPVWKNGNSVFFYLKSDILTTVAVMVWKPWDIEAWREKITSGNCTRRLRGPCQKPRRNFHIKVTGMLVRKFKSNRLLPLREIYVGSVNWQIQWLSIPNTLSETKICNLHPKARRRAFGHFNMGVPPGVKVYDNDARLNSVAIRLWFKVPVLKT